jgi:Ca-activated chloride channel family protein
LSQSMLAWDLEPTRLDVSKRVLSDFITWIQSDRTWLILFAGKAFQSIPLSYDYDFLWNFIEKITIDTIDVENPDLQGTAIWDALVLASDVLTRWENDREKVIILITDGTANRWVDPEVALKLLKEKNIKTYTIWVGKEGITVIDVSVWPGFTQRVEIPWVDEKSLQNIARETWWKYFRADSQWAFQEILDTISVLEKSELEIEQIQFHSSRTEILLYLLLLSFGFLGYIVFIKKIQL